MSRAPDQLDVTDRTVGEQCCVRPLPTVLCSAQSSLNIHSYLETNAQSCGITSACRQFSSNREFEYRAGRDHILGCVNVQVAAQIQASWCALLCRNGYLDTVQLPHDWEETQGVPSPVVSNYLVGNTNAQAQVGADAWIGNFAIVCVAENSE